MPKVLIVEDDEVIAQGMARHLGAAGFEVTARLVGPGRSSEMPVITSKNLVAAGSTAHLQGLLRDGRSITSYGLVNLGQSQAQILDS